MSAKKYIIIISLVLFSSQVFAQKSDDAKKFWQSNSELIPFRMPLPLVNEKLNYIDLDEDGDPDILQTKINGIIPIQWIDDDDDMKHGDVEGDMDSDCLMIDRNNDGFYGGEHDIILDWNDEDGDNMADIQVLVDYSGLDDRGLWKAHYMWFIDNDKDQLFNYIDWNTLIMEGWDHAGRANFFLDYHGQSTFLKVHTNTFNINDLRYNWENPFLFYDYDNDGETELAIRYIDDPIIVKDLPAVNKNQDIKTIEPSVLFTKKISSIQMGIDLDNDSKTENELDYDMSLKFSGEGFDYSDQVHKFNSLRGLPDADKYFFDPSWRQLEELIYVDHSNGYNFIFDRANWNECWLVFDEDDDCHRWERVEFYDPKDIFKVGAKNGGLDHNPQADVSGDRGEWDLDFSGKGKLYIGNFDGRIHLFGAEWGAWRVDQRAKYYQGWQGWRGENLQPEDLVNEEPEIFGTVKYSDNNGNGFFDVIEQDLDGDKIFETRISLTELGLCDSAEIIDISKYEYKDFNRLYKKVANNMWNRAGKFLNIAKFYNLNYLWYSYLLNPKSLREKYNNGYWLTFYLYNDLIHFAKLKSDNKLLTELNRNYFANEFNDWVYAKFVPERMDDFAWENDKIAFRMYGPALQASGEISNGIDVWVKSTNKLIIDDWYSKADYHVDHGEGLDYYKVGKTLGAGGSALLENSKLNKSTNFIDWNIVENGPLNTSFSLEYAPREYKNTMITETKTITLKAGSNLNKIKLNYESPNDSVIIENVIGIVKHKGEDNGYFSVNKEKGIISYWEPTNIEYGNTGIGIIVNPNKLNKIVETNEHYLIVLNPTNDKSLTYYAGACWSKNEEFSNYELWKNYLKEFHRKNSLIYKKGNNE